MDKLNDEIMLSIRLPTSLLESEINGAPSILKSLIDDSITKAEGNTLTELRKQIFCTVQVRTATWQNEPALIVLIEDVTGQTQSKFVHSYQKERQQ